MGRHSRSSKRTTTQAAADRAADDAAPILGPTLRQQRVTLRKSQAESSAVAGISPSTWSHLEVGRDGRVTLATWNRAATAMGGRLKVYIDGVSAADAPRDAVHLRNQELAMRVAASGGWRTLSPEMQLDRDARTSRMADIVLVRRHEYCLAEVFDWFSDVGAAARDWPRRLTALERHTIARMRDDTLPRVSGLWVVRATRRNRELVREHQHFFRALLPGSSATCLAALTDESRGMPAASGLLWVSVSGDRLFAPRFGSPR